MPIATNDNKYRAIDFFCGGGGMTCGLRQAGIDVIAGVDFDANAKETYEFNNPGSKFIQKDIKNLWSDYFERNFGVKPVIVINNIDIANMFDLVLNFERRFQKKQYRVFERYKILGYPYNMKSMLSENGFEEDDHIPLFKNLVLVI